MEAGSASQETSPVAGVTLPCDEWSDETLFVCGVCGKFFSSASYLSQHEKTHVAKKQFSCDICGKNFTLKCDLSAHLRVHAGEKPFRCGECVKSFPSSADLLEHQSVHAGEKRFSCDDCGKGFRTSSNLAVHRNIHTSEKTFSCHDCGKTFSRKVYLLNHMKIHTGERSFSCTHCGMCFRSSSNLSVHQTVHTGEKRFSCDICGKCYSSSSNLGVHKKVHSGEKPFSCNICGKCFRLKTLLLTHQEIHTDAVKKPSGVDWSKEFSRKDLSKVFVDRFGQLKQMSHTSQAPFTCSVCGLRFSIKSMLLSHERVHASGKTSRHDLMECFVQNNDISQQQSSTFRGEEIHENDAGGSSSSDVPQKQNNMSKVFLGKDWSKVYIDCLGHLKPIQQYTPNTLFACSSCGLRFSTKSMLLSHEKVHASGKDSRRDLIECYIQNNDISEQQNSTLGDEEISHDEDDDDDGSSSSDLPQRQKNKNNGFSSRDWSKVFVDSLGRLKPIEQYTSNVLFTCSVCGLRFSIKSMLLSHERVHASGKPRSVQNIDISLDDDGSLSSDGPQRQKNESKTILNYVGIGPKESLGGLSMKEEIDPLEDSLFEEKDPVQVFIKEEPDSGQTFINEESDSVNDLIKKEIDYIKEEMDPI